MFPNRPDVSSAACSSAELNNWRRRHSHYLVRPRYAREIGAHARVNFAAFFLLLRRLRRFRNLYLIRVSVPHKFSMPKRVEEHGEF